MTVSYQYEVASSTSGGFTRLLFMWRGSLYKLIYRELALFLLFFGIISALYRHALNPTQKRSFEQIVVYCDTFINLIPLSFVLGFYVAYVASRWWKQYCSIPWIDKVMHSVALYVTGNDEYGRMVRRALMRYLNLSLILVLRSISSAVKRRFPTLDHVVDSGFMTALELELFISVPSLEFNTYWIPCTWFINLLKEARANHRLSDPQGLKIIMEEFNEFRSKCGMLWSYDWVSIPLVYTQVVTLATYSFFAVALVGRQYIEGAIKPFQMKVDIYFPVFTVLQFFFFMGLLKVAEQLINPFGDDDEDFELNWLIDRHTKVAYLGVDTLMNRCPPLVKDIYYDSENIILPYTEAAAAYKRQTYRGSVANMNVPEAKQTMFLPHIAEEEEELDEIEGGEKKSTTSPRTSNASLAGKINEASPAAAEGRQGDSSPQSPRRMARSSAETVVTLDTQELPRPESITAAAVAAAKSNGRPTSALSEAVKMFSLKSRFGAAVADQPQQQPQQATRRPFLALAKTARVSIQPWPSATNLKSETVPGPLPQSRSFNIPSIDVRQPSVEDDGSMTSTDQSSIINRKRKSAIDCKGGAKSRGFLCRGESIEEVQEPQPRRPQPARFHSFPKFMIRRPFQQQQQQQQQLLLRKPLPRKTHSLEDSHILSKSSPELRLDVELESVRSPSTAPTTSTAGTCECMRASFFTGGDEDDDDEDEEEQSTRS